MAQPVYLLYFLTLDKIVDIIQAYFQNLDFIDLANGWHKQHLLRSYFLLEEVRRRKSHSTMIQLVHKTLLPQHDAYQGLDWREMRQESAQNRKKTQAYSSPISAQCLTVKPGPISKRHRSITRKCCWKRQPDYVFVYAPNNVYVLRSWKQRAIWYCHRLDPM